MKEVKLTIKLLVNNDYTDGEDFKEVNESYQTGEARLAIKEAALKDMEFGKGVIDADVEVTVEETKKEKYE